MTSQGALRALQPWALNQREPEEYCKQTRPDATRPGVTKLPEKPNLYSASPGAPAKE